MDAKRLLVLVEAVKHDLPIPASRAEQIAIAYIGRAEHPRVLLMQSFQGVHGFLFVHNPKVDGVVRAARHKELVVDDIDGVGGMRDVVVKQFSILVNFPKDALAIETARDYAVLRVAVHALDVAMVAVMSIHIGHLPNIPHFKGTVS